MDVVESRLPSGSRDNHPKLMTSMTESDGIDGDLYGADKPQPKSVDQQESDNPTALLPKSILAGKEFKPGEEVVLKIVAIHGDEVEVSYSSEPEAKDEEATSESDDEELKSMNESY